ncbi:MAG: hypothetical protein KIT09_09365 [Bryobacteraceae bacterium]|nr:hypothetical protein [Bryobacteraceae bacterium]
MRQARWGVMTHYLADTVGKGTETTVEEWNRLIDNFDVEGLARQLEAARAGYYLITLGQNSGFYLSPNGSYDKYVGIKPSKCSRRDLIADLAKALGPRGIKLMTYLPAGAPDRDAVAMKTLEWKRGPYSNLEFQKKWEQVIREWSLRWGSRVAGWWFDGCYWPNIMYRGAEPPNFASFAAAARAGNPASALAFNRGVLYPIISITEQEDYTAGEINEPGRVRCSGQADAPFRCAEVDGAQYQMLSYLGQTWGKGPPRFSNDEAIKHTRNLSDGGGAVTWDVPIEASGLISAPFAEQLKSIGKALAGK